MPEHTTEFLAQFPKNYGRSYSPEKPDFSRCADSVHNGHFSSQCKRKNGYGPNGAWCKQHDPVAVKAKRVAASAKYQAESDARSRQWEFERECQSAIRAIAAGHNYPLGLAQSIIDKLEAK